MNRIFIFAFAFLGAIAVAKPFRVAALYPTTQVGHINCTCGFEAACITEAATERAKKAGLNISLQLFQTDRNVIGAMEAAKKVADQQFDAALGTLVSAEAIPVSEILEEAGILFITPTATNPKVTENKKFSLRIPFNDFRQALLLARLAATELHAHRVVVIRNTSSPYSDFLGLEFSKQIAELPSSIKITELSIIDGFHDFKDLADKILVEKPDLIFVPLYQAQIASLYTELAIHNPKLILLGSDTIEGKPRFLELMGPRSKNIRFIYPKHWNEKFDTKASQDYLTLQRKHCGQYLPSMAGAAAYDATEILIKALKLNPQARGLELVNAIRRIKYNGVTGSIRYGTDGDPIKPIELFEVKGGDAHYWKRYE